MRECRRMKLIKTVTNCCKNEESQPAQKVNRDIQGWDSQAQSIMRMLEDEANKTVTTV